MSANLPSPVDQYISVARSFFSVHLSFLRFPALQSPLVRAVLQAVCISASANIAAQLLSEHRKGEPLSVDFGFFIRFLIISVIMAPLNYCWQAFLERTFPSKRLVDKKSADDDISSDISQQDPDGSEVHLLHDNASEGENRGERDIPEGSTTEESKSEKMQPIKLYIWHTFLKLFVDCFLLGTWWNVVLFLILNGTLKLDSGLQILRSVKVETIPIVLDAFKLWPFVFFLGLTLLPMERRIVFYSAVNIFWSIYMSWVAGREPAP